MDSQWRGARGPRLFAVAAVLVLGVLILGSLGGVLSRPVSASNTPINDSTAAAPASASVTTGPLRQATPIAGPFWGLNTPTAQRFNGSDATYVEATPVTYLRFPGGILGEEYNYTSSVLTKPDGSQSVTTTSTAMFVSACKAMGCRAILQLPAEINRPGTAAYYAYYVVHTLGYQPAYWEIGNDPSGWTHFNVTWSNWKTTGGGNTTPAAFAQEVQTYITAVTAVDPGAQFLALGSGLGIANYGEAWVKALVRADGHELAGVSVHSYVQGGPTNPTDSQLFANLIGTDSLVNQVTADRAYITEACPTCTQIGVFVTEINAAEQDGYTQLLPTFAGTLYLAAEIDQGLSVQATNLDWFAYNSHYEGSWTTTHAGSWQGQYYLFRDLTTQLGNETLPTQVSGPSSFFAQATYGTSGVQLLLVNVNTTTPVSVDLAGAGLSTSATIDESFWTNATTEPVASRVAYSSTVTLPPMSIELLAGPAAPAVTDYSVTFSQSGLPTGTNWTVTVGATQRSTSGSSMTFSEPNGTYGFTVVAPSGYVASPSNGNVTVAGTGVAESIAFSVPAVPTYSVAFKAAGLTTGATWKVTFNGSSVTSTAVTIAFSEPNGTYAYAVRGPAGYTVTPASGNVSVAGSPLTQSEEFVTLPAPTYAVTFSESGLATASSWSVSVNNSSHSSPAPNTIVVPLPNGTYSFSIGGPSGYTVSPSHGTVSVAGATVQESVQFAPIPSGSGGGNSSIRAVQGRAQTAGGGSLANVVLTLTFRTGGSLVEEVLNVTTNSTGVFSVSGLNLTGNLSAIDPGTPTYRVVNLEVSRPTNGTLAVTVVLRAVTSSAGPPGGSGANFLSVFLPLNIATVGLLALVGALAVTGVRASLRARRRERYQEYFDHPGR